MIIGIFLPSVLYPFAEPPGPYRDGAFGAKAPITKYEIVIKKGKWVPGEGTGVWAILSGHYEGRVIIPYKYFIAIGITIFFIGLTTLVFKSRNIAKN
jgi:hypothetical protein